MQGEGPHDSSTPIWNRDSILELFARELARTASEGSQLTVILAGIDQFKNLQGLHGELQGDLVAREIAQRLSASLHRYDYIGRYSAEQLLILAPGCGVSEAVPLAETLRAAAAKSAIELLGIRTQVTLSLSVATSTDFPSHKEQELLRELEKLQYRAEKNGGNRVEALGSLRRTAPPAAKRRPLPVGWILAGTLAAGIAVVYLVAPSWLCTPFLLGDISDSAELPPPLPANCMPTTERASEATLQTLDSRREAGGLALQGTVTCKISAAPASRAKHLLDQQWLDSVYPDGSMQYRRHVLLTASQDVPGGKLFTVELCLMPWWKYIDQANGHCWERVAFWR